MMRVCHLDTCPGRHRHPEPRAAGQVQRPARVRRDLLRVHRRGGARAPGRRSACARWTRPSAASTCSTPTRRSPTGRPPASTSPPFWPSPTWRPRWGAARPGCRTTGSRRRSTTPFLDACAPALDRATPVSVELPIANVDRTVGTLLGSEIIRALRRGRAARRHHLADLHRLGRPELRRLRARGVTLRLCGRRQRLLRQGALRGPRSSCARRRTRPSWPRSRSSPATSSSTAPRRARPSSGARWASASACATPGATAVVEGVGDHGCEYMTGGAGRRARADRTQLRRRHVGRGGLRLRPGRTFGAAGQPRDGGRRAARRRGQRAGAPAGAAPRRRDRLAGGRAAAGDVGHARCASS